MNTDYYPKTGERWLIAEDYDFGSVTGNIVNSFTTRQIHDPISFYNGTQHSPILCPVAHTHIFKQFGVTTNKEMVAITNEPGESNSSWCLIPVPDNI